MTHQLEEQHSLRTYLSQDYRIQLIAVWKTKKWERTEVIEQRKCVPFFFLFLFLSFSFIFLVLPLFLNKNQDKKENTHSVSLIILVFALVPFKEKMTIQTELSLSLFHFLSPYLFMSHSCFSLFPFKEKQKGKRKQKLTWEISTSFEYLFFSIITRTLLGYFPNCATIFIMLEINQPRIS